MGTGRGRCWSAGWCWGLGPFQPIEERADPCGDRSSRLSIQTYSPRAIRVGKRSPGSDLKNSWSCFLGRRVLDALFVDRDSGAADLEADGVVDDEEEGQAGVAVWEPGGVQRLQDSLGQGQRVRSEGVAGLEQAGDPGMVFQDVPQSMRERLDLLGPTAVRG